MRLELCHRADSGLVARVLEPMSTPAGIAPVLSALRQTWMAYETKE